MKKYIIICVFLFLIPTMFLVGNSIVKADNDDGVQYISENTADVVADIQIVNNNLQVSQMIEQSQYSEQNISGNHINKMVSNNVTEIAFNNSLVITANNNLMVSNKQYRVNGISIIRDDFGTVNRITSKTTDLNISSINGMNNAYREMQRVIGFGSINQFEIANNQTPLVYSPVVNNNAACVSVNTTISTRTVEMLLI